MPIHYETQARKRRQARFRQNILTVILSVLLGFVLFKLLQQKFLPKPPRVIHADRWLHFFIQVYFIDCFCRYSADYKYRPAASPIVTEYLDDGTIRLRGANHHDTHAIWRQEL